MNNTKIKSKHYTMQEGELINLVIKYWSIIQYKITDHADYL